VDRTELSGQLTEQVPGLLRYARSISSDPRHAEDLVQDTVVRALERSGSFRGESSLATWLHRILHNLAVDQVRRRREVPTDLSDESAVERVDTLWREDSYTVDSTLVLERAETAERLQDALLRLPLIYRSAVVLHDEEGLTMSSVAQIQDIGLPAAKLAWPQSSSPSPEVPMRCWDARHRVSEYMDQELTQRERSLLEAHLERCPMCPPLYASLMGVRAALSARRDSDAVVPSDLAARILGAADGPG